MSILSDLLIAKRCLGYVLWIRNKNTILMCTLMKMILTVSIIGIYLLQFEVYGSFCGYVVLLITKRMA